MELVSSLPVFMVRIQHMSMNVLLEFLEPCSSWEFLGNQMELYYKLTRTNNMQLRTNNMQLRNSTVSKRLNWVMYHREMY